MKFRPTLQGPTLYTRPDLVRFRASVWDYYREYGRHDLPWRKNKDPYKILVSEVMLQQTQVPRVIEKYKEFLKAFPTVEVLARSNLADVLNVWSGMGYNRRAKYLRDAAIEIVNTYKGKVPRDVVSLRALPGIGPYTASAVLIFAFNIPDTLIETNVRSVFIHHFFGQHRVIPRKHRGQISVNSVDNYRDLTSVRTSVKGSKQVADRELLPYIEAAAQGQDPREWHWALMDYGSHLKKLHPNPSRASAHYMKQSKFEGSLRQVRGAILRELHRGEASIQDLPFEKGKIERALAGLTRDGMIENRKGKWNIG
ncbi:MAG TPA: A/G-specific adenine glycosylase [Candidatus Paceibacterota bacterium]|nr:A/G-specific adenine glycosylase [Candidatus Paceibacterota bacterium]